MADFNVTPYLEANAILAAQAEDVEALVSILDKMLPGELRKLREAADTLHEACGLALAFRDIEGDEL